MQTIKVFWKDKFNGRAVVINAADFDPAIHQVGQPWPTSVEQPVAGEEPNPLLVEVNTAGSDQAPKPRGRKKSEE